MKPAELLKRLNLQGKEIEMIEVAATALTKVAVTWENKTWYNTTLFIKIEDKTYPLAVNAPVGALIAEKEVKVKLVPKTTKNKKEVFDLIGWPTSSSLTQVED